MTHAAAWRDIPIGTPVIVRGADGTLFETRTASRPFEMMGGVPVVRVTALGADDYYALDRVHLAARVPCRDCIDVQRCLQAGHCIGTGETDTPAPSVTIAAAIQAPPRAEPLAFVDRPTTILVIAILACLAIGVSIAARLIFEGPDPQAPAWICEETGFGCSWRESP